MYQTIRDIFIPTPTKLLLAVVFTVFGHLYLTEEAVRRSAGAELAGAQDFWLTNLIDALPYLKTDNIVLKFLTFFVLSYAVVWILSKLIRLAEQARLAAIKRWRRAS